MVCRTMYGVQIIQQNDRYSAAEDDDLSRVTLLNAEESHRWIHQIALVRMVRIVRVV
jgi:hypothetical protein